MPNRWPVSVTVGVLLFQSRMNAPMPCRSAVPKTIRPSGIAADQLLETSQPARAGKADTISTRDGEVVQG